MRQTIPVRRNHPTTISGPMRTLCHAQKLASYACGLRLSKKRWGGRGYHKTSYWKNNFQERESNQGHCSNGGRSHWWFTGTAQAQQAWGLNWATFDFLPLSKTTEQGHDFLLFPQNNSKRKQKGQRPTKKQGADESCLGKVNKPTKKETLIQQRCRKGLWFLSSLRSRGQDTRQTSRGTGLDVGAQKHTLPYHQGGGPRSMWDKCETTGTTQGWQAALREGKSYTWQLIQLPTSYQDCKQGQWLNKFIMYIDIKEKEHLCTKNA